MGWPWTSPLKVVRLRNRTPIRPFQMAAGRPIPHYVEQVDGGPDAEPVAKFIHLRPCDDLPEDGHVWVKVVGVEFNPGMGGGDVEQHAAAAYEDIVESLLYRPPPGQ